MLWKANEEIIDDITCVVIFMDQKLIKRNFTQEDLSVHQRPNFGMGKSKVITPKIHHPLSSETMLEDILAADNIIMEEEDEQFTTN